MNACPSEEKLQRMLAEELASPERVPVEAHVQRCPHCQRVLEHLTDVSHLRPLSPSARAGEERLNPNSTADTQSAAAGESLTLDFLAPPTRPGALGRLGHYEVLQVLGRGGFGIVFRAYDDVLQRPVAIKVLSPTMAATSPARKRFLREARSSAQVCHENVVQVYAVEEQPLPFLVMEFVPGETLQQRLDRKGPFETAEVVAIGRQVAQGLAAAHAAGLIHRDVKPANVMVEDNPRLRVKITDFGLARAADDASLTQSGALLGTPLYMSPEQARGDRLDPRSDLFSFGSVLYSITTGRPPFRARNSLVVLRRVAEEAPRSIPEIIPETPAWLCAVIAKLMAKEPDQRYQIAQEVADALATGTAPTKPKKPGGSLRWAVAGAAILLLAALCAILIVLGNRQWLETKVEASNGTTETDKTAAGSNLAPAGSEVPLPADFVLERKAAEWTISLGGFVRVFADDPDDIRDKSRLPDAPFILERVDLGGVSMEDDDLVHLEGLKGLRILSIGSTQVTDAGFIHLRNHTQLRVLYMGKSQVTGAGFVHLKDLPNLWEIWSEFTPITDDGLVPLKDLKALRKLGIGGTQVTDAGLAHLKDCKNLGGLWVDNTAVTDAGLAHLQHVKGLAHLKVSNTKVTAQGLAAFRAALPRCTIEYDGGVLEPAK